MKAFYFLFLFITLCITSCFGSRNYSHMANEVIGDYSLYLDEKGYSIFGSGGGWTTDIRDVSINIIAFREVNIEQARKMFVDCMENFINRINNNTEIRPFLRDFPFTYKNARISLSFFKNSQLDHVKNTNIAIVLVDNNLIHYEVNNELEGMFITVYTETYEEALSIVRGQNKCNQGMNP